MGENAWKYSMEKPEEEEQLGVDGKIITKQVIRKQAERVWTEFICSEQGPMAG